VETINCKICQSNVYEKFISLTDRFNISNNIFTLVKCECGFTYLNPRPNENEIIKFYNTKKYLPHSNISFFYKVAQKFSFLWKYRLIHKLIKKSGKILDYGAGDGSFANYLKSKNFNIDTFEPILKNKTSKINDQKYDLITLWHSLEHIHDLNSCIDNIKNILNINGKILIAVPNVDSIESDIFKSDWVAYDAPRHLYHFNPESMKKLLDKHNIYIEKRVPVLQDTLFNIISSIKSENLLLKIFKFIFLTIYSLFIIKINSKYSSSNIYICSIK